MRTPVLHYAISDLYAYVYKESIGYTFYIKRRLNGKLTTIAQSYCYYGKKDDCINKMREEIDILLDMSPLFK